MARTKYFPASPESGDQTSAYRRKTGHFADVLYGRPSGVKRSLPGISQVDSSFTSIAAVIKIRDSQVVQQ